MPSIINALTASGGGVAISGDATGNLALQTAGTTAMTITTAQNVGIGTSSPSQKLDVAGNAFLTYSGGDNYLYFQQTANYIGRNGSTGDIWLNCVNGQNVILGVNGTEQASISASSGGLFKFNSGYGSSAVAYGCRSWVNFDGSATPPTIRASGNVSSVTRSATGTWDINFTTSLTDANFAVGFSVQPSVTNVGSDSFAENLAAGSYRIKHFEDGTLRNSPTVLSLVVR